MDFWDANFLKNVGFFILASFINPKNVYIQGILQLLNMLYLDTFPGAL